MQVLIILILVVAALGFAVERGVLGPEIQRHVAGLPTDFLTFILYPPAPWGLVMLALLALVGVVLLLRLVRWVRDILV